MITIKPGRENIKEGIMKLLLLLVLVCSVGFGIEYDTVHLYCCLCGGTTSYKIDSEESRILNNPDSTWRGNVFGKFGFMELTFIGIEGKMCHKSCWNSFWSWLIERYIKLKDLELFRYIETAGYGNYEYYKMTRDDKPVWTFGAVEKSSSTED